MSVHCGTETWNQARGVGGCMVYVGEGEGAVRV